MKRIPLAVCALLLISGCKSPADRTHDPASGPTGTFSTGGQFPIFNGELVTGGGAFEYPGGNNLSLTFDDHSNPISKRSIRFSWNGLPSDGSTLTFAGMSLMFVPLLSQYNTTTPRDLRAAGYTKAVFSIRGDLSTYTSVKIEAGGPTSPCITLSMDGSADECSSHDTGTLSNGWVSHTLTLTPGDQSAIKDFLKATFVFNNPTPGNTNPGQGGTIYLDQISYRP